MTFELIAVTPFGRPDVRFAEALGRAGATSVLDLGTDAELAGAALDAMLRRTGAPFGVRLQDPSIELPAQVEFVVLADPAYAALHRRAGRRVAVEVTTLAHARVALAHGATDLIAKGWESGGIVGAESTFVLLQRLVSALDCPVHAAGGIGVHTIAAAYALGAAGAVLDSQLALLAEASVNPALRARLAHLDGSETRIVDGQRLLPNPLRGKGSMIAELGSERESLVAGQDAAFASELAARYRTAAGLIRGLQLALRAALRTAQRALPLDAGSALAVRHGTRYPIVQGPMTRVSDRPEFAAAVADGGALPLLALALLPGDEVARLVAATRTALGERPFGVGVLGFAPAELREQQLAAIEAAKPPFALISGGHPSQAQRLEHAGIVTYLHAPSAALLEDFLDAGVRGIVLEGSECGGHVGPRTSFVLWEQAVERMLRRDDLEGLRVLFAGGIHDARSASSVAAVAAPLVARGVEVGVLIGTAYLFTREAVATGAIGATYQAASLRCRDTVLLETAPGHATRAARTPYASAFEAERRRLEAAATPAPELWARLEQLNLGRLRVASRGLVRDGAVLRPAEPAEQLREGLFMLGQVAALQTRRTSIEALHTDVSTGAMRRIAALPLPDAQQGRAPADVAIVGMACIFPGAADLGAYWTLVLSGRTPIGEVPEDRWNKDVYYDPTGRPGTSSSKWGGFVPPVIFEPAEFGIPPSSVPSIDPGQLLALKVAKAALADAGLGAHNPARDRTSVIVGAGAGGSLVSAYHFRALHPGKLGALPSALDDHLPEFTEDSFPGTLSNVIAGRISNRFDFGGVNFTVDAACASSLAALDAACKELLAGTSDVVVAGGVDLHNGIEDYVGFTSVQALSPHGRCRTFDAAADGIVLGEGVAAVVLKRLSDAQRDGDRVYAVIKGVGGSSDGRCLGLTAPRLEGQRLALERAYEHAGIEPCELGLIEAHGTGTVVGDRTELTCLTELLLDASAARGSCTLGSVKSTIGHTKCAAGLAGLIKAALAIHHRVLPPTFGIETPNASYRSSASPFVFRDRPAPWLAAQRVAGVSAMGFGGTNFHVVLSQAPTNHAALATAWPFELFVFRGDLEEARDTMRRAAELTSTPHAQLTLAQLAARVCATGQPAAPVQFAIVAESFADLEATVADLLAGGESSRAFARDDEGLPPRVALLFPGQGSQRPHMTADLCVWLGAQFEMTADAELGAAIYPAAAFDADTRARQRAALRDTRTAQPALGAAALASADLLAWLGIDLFALGGHSYGELAALTYGGGLGRDRLAFVSRARAEAIRAAVELRAGFAPPGAMVAVLADVTTTEALIPRGGHLVLANRNGPRQQVVAGPSDEIVALIAECEAHGIVARRLDVDCAFHSPLLAGASDRFAHTLEGEALKTPRVPVWSNVHAAPHADEPDAIRAALARQLEAPVRFEEQTRSMYEAGARVFVEVGPGRALTGMVEQVLSGEPHCAVALDDPSRHGLESFLLALAKLAVTGVPMRLERLFASRVGENIGLGEPPVLPSDAAFLIDGHLARPLRGEIPARGLKPLRQPVASAQCAASADREQTVLEFIRTGRAIVEAQQAVLLRHLEATSKPGQAFAPSPATPAPTPSANGTGEDHGAVSGERPSSDDESPADVLATLLEIIARRTGYPRDMIDPALDLEADLGIDSIKRSEILSALNRRIKLWDPRARADGRPSEDVIGALAECKTASAIADAVADMRYDRSGRPADAPLFEAKRTVVASAEPALAAANAAPRRLLPTVVAITPAKRDADLTGLRCGVLAPESELAAALCARIAGAGATADRLDDLDAATGHYDGWFDLSALSGRVDTPWPLMQLCRRAALERAAFVVVGTAHGAFNPARCVVPGASGGAAALLKSAAAEIPALRLRAVELDPDAASAAMGDALVHEACARDEWLEVAYQNGTRLSRRFVARELDRGAQRVALGPGSVVLATGGARGLTAQVVIALARRYGCHFVLLGRSAAPVADETPELAACADANAVRRLLLERAELRAQGPRAIEAECARLIREREHRQTLEAIVRAGGSAAYRTVDVRDSAALSRAVAAVYAEHGTITGAVHGAGVIDDRRLADKTEASFACVFDTKARAADALLRCLREDLRFLLLFGSVAGAYGSQGQADYAAANERLDLLALALTRDASCAARVLSVDFGPITGAGMVTPELERLYRTRGIGLLAATEAAELCVDELVYGDAPQVVLTDAGIDEPLEQAPLEQAPLEHADAAQ